MKPNMEIEKILKTLDYLPAEMLTTAIELILLSYLQVCPQNSKEDLMDYIMKSFDKSMMEFNNKLEDIIITNLKNQREGKNGRA